MHENLARARALLGLFDEMDLVRWVVERGDIRSRRWDLAVLEHAEVGVVQDLGGVVDLRVGGGDSLLGHGCGKRDDVRDAKRE